MKLDRDEFVVTYAGGNAREEDLISIIREAGYTANVVTGEVGTDESIGTDNGSLDDPLFTEALDRAKRERKPIVLDFMASWCVPCKRMEKETFADPEVAKLLKQVVFLKVDTDEHPDLAKHFSIEGLPDIRFLDSDGTEVRRLTDFQDAALFSETLNKLLSPASENESSREAAAVDELPSLNDLSNDASEFRQTFNNAKGSVRVIVLVSPG
jgi:thioredoxin 1